MSYKPIIIALIATSLTACSLDEHPKDQIEESQIYTSEQALYQNAVASLYSYVGGNTDGQGLQGTLRGVYDLQTFGSDEAIMPRRGVDWYDGGIWQDLYRHSWSPGHEIVKNSWLYLYKVITLCNRSLETIEKYDYLLFPIQKERYTAEVRALRAIYYWYLLDLYGRVPIVTTSDVSMNEVMQAERSQVFDFVRKELESTLTILPNRSSVEKNEYYGRVTMPVACFVLAKLYLNAEVYCNDDWTHSTNPDGKDMKFDIYGRQMNAWEACLYFCQNIQSMGFLLEGSYDNNFKIHNETSKENIWTIPMDKYLITHLNQNIVRSLHWRHAAAYGFTGSNGTSATWTALQANHYGKDDEDSRFKSNYWAGEVADNNSEIITDRTGKPLTYMPYEVNIDMTGSPYLETAGARMKKYEIDINATEKGKQMENDIVLFRYADVLLMMAEAKVRNGETGQWEFDLVRSRARMPLRQATLDNIYEERLIELAWEGWRRNDMIRFNRYKSEYNGGNAVDESDHHTIVFPIPANARATNANLKQHLGY